jgi:hypothetical protein
MRLKNYTNIPTDYIRAIIRAVCPPSVTRFDVRISNGRVCRGRAYHAGSGYHATADPFIVCIIPKKERLIMHPRGAYLGMVLGSRIEQLVVLVSHELRHLWQAKHRQGEVWGSKGRFSERDADAYALRMLRRFRRGELITPTPEAV